MNPSSCDRLNKYIHLLTKVITTGDCVYYQVSGSGQHKEGEAEVKVLLDDQMSQEWGQHNPTHAQEVGNRPRILVLQKNGWNACCSNDG